jgi:hypothetical protein
VKINDGRFSFLFFETNFSNPKTIFRFTPVWKTQTKQVKTERKITRTTKKNNKNKNQQRSELKRNKAIILVRKF